MTWDVPVKDDCPVCGQTMFKKAGRGFKKPFCINPACSNFLPEDKRGYPRKKTEEDAAAEDGKEQESGAEEKSTKKTAAKKTTAKTAAKKTAAKSTAKKTASKTAEKSAAKKTASKSAGKKSKKTEETEEA